MWGRGKIYWKLDKTQREIYAQIKENKSNRFVVECARRLGKSYLLCLMAIEECLAAKRNVVYAAPTQKEVRQIILPLIDKITEDAPDGCKPQWSVQDSAFNFPNGSRIVVFGCEDMRKAQRGRGSECHLAIVDEAGFIPILSYVLGSILGPQLLTTKGRLLVASTPSDEPDHDFTRLAERAEADGTYCRKTLYDNPRLSKKDIDKHIADDAQFHGFSVDEFVKTDVFKREYLAERAVDKTLCVVGDDWETVKADALKDATRPKFFDSYVVLDFGGIDPHAALFAYWDFARRKLVIEDELLLRDGENTEQLAAAIKAKEKALWGVDQFNGTVRGAYDAGQLPKWVTSVHPRDCPAQPFFRICDNDAQLANDLATMHGLAFIPTEKQEKKHYVNQMRVALRSGEIEINPRCVNLDRHLRTTMWLNARATDYKRKNGEHGDLVDCLVYLWRNVRRDRNPMPPDFHLNPGKYFVPESMLEDAGDKALIDAFGGK